MKVQFIEDDTTTAVEVQASAGPEPWTPLFVARGFARRHPDDEPDVEVGRTLALSRAFRSLHRQLRDYGYSSAGQ